MASSTCELFVSVYFRRLLLFQRQSPASATMLVISLRMCRTLSCVHLTRLFLRTVFLICQRAAASRHPQYLIQRTFKSFLLITIPTKT